MRWLITVGRHITPQALESALAAIRLSFDATQTPTPVDGDEVVYRLDAPDDAAQRLRRVPGVRQVNPYTRPDKFSARA